MSQPYNQLDKIVVNATILCFIFWVLAKIPIEWDFIPFGIVYEAGGWILTAFITIGCSLYFLVKWIRSKFTLSKMYVYCFMLSILTLVIMRFVYSITFEGITLMPNYSN